jgi:hypothetical protein
VARFLAVGGLYASTLAFVYVAWTVDLWAKSFDLPRAQRLAKALLFVVAATGLAGFALLATFAIELTHGATAVSGLAILLVPPLALVLLTLYLVDLRLVDAGAFVGLASVAALQATVRPVVVPLVAGLGLAILALSLTSVTPRWRFHRYARSLERDCSCCGRKQRALHELADMGVRGEAVIVRYLDSPEGRMETRVQEDWRRYRLTR